MVFWEIRSSLAKFRRDSENDKICFYVNFNELYSFVPLYNQKRLVKLDVLVLFTLLRSAASGR